MGGRIEPTLSCQIVSHSPEETQAFAEQLGKQLPPNSVLCLKGDLGAGKTCFVAGLAAGFGDADASQVCSPTFAILNIYGSDMPVYHFDLYRLSNEDEFCMMGFDEYLTAGGLVCIEWSERIEGILSDNCIVVSLEHLGEEERRINVIDKRSADV